MRRFDAEKNRVNIAKHGLSFDDIEALEWSTAITSDDSRTDYGELRFVTYGMRHNRLHCLIWTGRDGVLRPISFRKANAREREKYEKETKTQNH